ncbi:hypothetical protein ACFC0D_16475 [Streptomyces sp. NPDC056222]|uniref:hypothetical protein n=1 Tax=Streptomyces sp. NPDC056222 TaxID=3345749 RepID=UPI0035DE76AA
MVGPTSACPPSWARAAGETVTNPSDLNRFYTALSSVAYCPARLQQLTTTVPTEGNPSVPALRLGLIEYETSCGIKVWGHSGGIHGPSTQAFGTKDGWHVIALNCNGDWVGGGKNVVSAEFCTLPTSTQPPAPTTSG